MALIDILVVGLVLAFIISRFFRHELPKDTRKPGERKMPDWQGIAQAFQAREQAGDDMAKPNRKVRKPKVVDVKGLSGIELLKAHDDSFDEMTFKDGTAKAYQYFYQCWNAMDVPGLDKLCGPELMAQLEQTLEDYKRRGAKPEVLVNRVDKVELLNVDVKRKTAVVEVTIDALQSEGEVTAGKTIANQALPRTTRSVWVLARALTSDDPNWELQSIRHEGAKA